MNLSQRVYAFAKLGDFLLQYSETENKISISEEINKIHYDSFLRIIKESAYYNPWFTEENIRFAINAIACNLNYNKLKEWISDYSINEENQHSKKIGVLMAGNVPFVGFHDFLSILISGNKLICKPSSEDSVIPKKIAEILCDIEPEFKEYIEFRDGIMKDADAIIATGSNNSALHFEYYFRNYPHIIRKHRNSIAIINENISSDDLNLLADDIFTYFGMGCRSVSKVFIPENFDINMLIQSFEKFKHYRNNHRYFNNYEYNKAIYLVNNEKHLDNGFVMLKESNTSNSPVSVLFYEYYKSVDDVIEYINTEEDNIQCIVSDIKGIEGSIPYGYSQRPGLKQYADNIDVMKFLLNLYKN
ncbi:MAG: acyl-CoA reductase [Bacteroidota bacterium]|nr:acyl-CoA reductase [Bacteroidota bacterium]